MVSWDEPDEREPLSGTTDIELIKKAEFRKFTKTIAIFANRRWAFRMETQQDNIT